MIVFGNCVRASARLAIPSKVHADNRSKCCIIHDPARPIEGRRRCGIWAYGKCGASGGAPHKSPPLCGVVHDLRHHQILSSETVGYAVPHSDVCFRTVGAYRMNAVAD